MARMICHSMYYTQQYAIHLIVSIFKLTNALVECQMVVCFTPAVYKYLLGQDCTLDDLKIEDPSLYKCVLVLIMYSTNLVV